MEINKIFLISLCFLFSTTIKLYAGWSGSTTILSGTWGNGIGQFGIEEGDGCAQFAGPFYLLSDGTIIIQDSKNGRFVRYSSSGTIITTTVCVQDAQGNWNGDCRIEGDYEVAINNNGFWTGSDEGIRYYFQDNTGTLLTTTTTRPMELGIVTGKCMTGKLLSECKSIQYSIEYPDAIYVYQEGTRYADFSGQIRIGTNTIMDNQKGHVYAFNITQTTTASGSKPMKWLGWTATWTKPADLYGTPVNDGVETIAPVVAQYGSPIIGPDGSLYCWKRTQTNYMILKWTWMP